MSMASRCWVRVGTRRCEAEAAVAPKRRSCSGTLRTVCALALNELVASASGNVAATAAAFSTEGPHAVR